MPNAALSRPARLPSLTGLRFAAAALVVGLHASPLFGDLSFERPFALGYVGVTFFFVLSGFVLAWSADGPVRAATFYWRRFARVYPLHLVTWAAAVAVAFVIAEQSVASVLLSLVLLQAWAWSPEISRGGNVPSWSLSCEALFYLVFPLLVSRKVGFTRRPEWLVPAVLIVTGVGVVFSVSPAYHEWITYTLPIYRVGQFILGILLAAAVRHRTLPRLPLWLGALLIVVPYVLLDWLGGPDVRRGLVDALVLPGICLLLAAAAQGDLEERRTIWSSTWMVRLGTWSFALYLVHFAFARVLPKVLPGGYDPPLPVGVVELVLFLVVMTALAGLAYELVERPAERWLRERQPVGRVPSPRAEALPAPHVVVPQTDPLVGAESDLESVGQSERGEPGPTAP